MNQVLVRLFIPTIEKSYDVFLPLNRKVYNIILLLVKAVNELNDDCYKPANMPGLYEKFTGKMYDPYATVKENEIVDGTEVILI